jgi:hypothetical protein
LTDDLQRWVLVWLAAAIWVVVRRWRAGRTAGLVLGYVVCFGAIDWFGAALCLLPWSPSAGLRFVVDGTRLSAFGMVAFAVGTEIAAFLFARRSNEPEVDLGVTVDNRLVNLYLAVGLFLQGVMAPLARNIPSVNALVGAGSSLAVLAVALKCWNAWQENRPRDVWPWLIASCCFPIFTVLTQGFLGYGLNAMLMIVAFVAAFHGPRLRVVIGAAVLAYLGLTVYVNYMRDRADIRTSVWGGASMGDRLSTVRESAASAEWFDLRNDAHLRRIDDRLNQNWLVGAAVAKMSAGSPPFARGGTLWSALLAIVPRVFWPDKDIAAGSGDLVSTYTGLRFQGDTSVGIGQLMEWYVNFDESGVVVGFLIFGVLIMLIDRRAIQSLHLGNAETFILWYLPGLNLLNVGGSFVDATSSAAAAFVLAIIMRVVGRRLWQATPRQPELAIGTGPRSSPEPWSPQSR